MTAALSEQCGGHTALEGTGEPSGGAEAQAAEPGADPAARPLPRPRAGPADALHDEPGRTAPIARLIERDEQAFSEIVRQYGDKVFSLIYRMLGNRQEAEDVAQDVFITVFKTIESFRGEAKFSTWLLRIAANHAKNRIKHLARRPTEGADPDDVSQLRRCPIGRSRRCKPESRPRTRCWKRCRPNG